MTESISRRAWRDRARSVALAAAVIAGPGYALAAPVLKGPPPRAITDPTTITSAKLADAAPVPIADLYFSRSSMDGVWSADGKHILMNLNLTGRGNLWKVPVKGGFPVQLTQSNDMQYGLNASPDGKWLAYQSDHDGHEIFDLYAVPVAGGAVTRLTATDDMSEVFPVFSPDSRLLGFGQRAKAAPSINLAVMDVATRKVRQLTHEKDPNFSWAAVAFSPDARQLIANRWDVAMTDSSIWRIDVASGAATQLSDKKAGSYNKAVAIAPDGRWISMETVTAAGDRQAALMDAATGKVKLLRADPWEQSASGFSPDSRSVLIVSNVNGRDVVYRHDIASGQSTRLSIPDGVSADTYFGKLPAYSPDGATILFRHESGSSPQDYWTLDTASGKAAQVTQFNLASLDAARLPKSQIVNYRSEDGTVISAILWMPFNLERDGRAPGVVLPHGGPTGQTRDTFDQTAIALATRGYVAIAPNPRGSTGYGMAFQKGNVRDLGGGDLVDIVYGAKFLAATGYVDARKIGITGGSYGGYLTLMAMGKTPDVWAAGVEQYGIVNWFSMWENGSPQLRFYQEGLIGHPVKDKAVYEAASPLTYLRNTQAPMLVLQGENDLRVPKEQAEEVVEILKKAGRTVDAKYYPAEGHGFSKREHQIDALERVVAWFDRYLKGK